LFFPHFIVPLHLLRKVIEVVEAVDGGAVDADDDVAAAESVFVGLAALAHQAYNWFAVDGNVGECRLHSFHIEMLFLAFQILFILVTRRNQIFVYGIFIRNDGANGTSHINLAF